MNRISILIISAICSLMCIFVADASDNVAYKDKNVRITLVTDGLARLEYSPREILSMTHPLWLSTVIIRK